MISQIAPAGKQGASGISTAPNPDLLGAALQYRERGWSIIPTKAKRPALKSWKRYQQEPADEKAIKKWFSGAGCDGLAVVLGRVSGGLACRDFDVRESYGRWAEQYPDLAATLPTAETARGAHVYFRGPDGFQVLDDGEYRADPGHYCCLPPSQHPSGPLYRWIVQPAGELPKVDPENYGLLQSQDNTPGDPHARQHIACVPKPTVEVAILSTLPSGPGQRNRKLFDLARALKGVPGLDISPKNLRAIVAEWHRQALPFIRTKTFDASWIDFTVSWGRVKYVSGASMGACLERARSIPPHPAGLVYDDERIRFLVTVCSCLQEQHGERPFFLSARQAAEVMGVSKSEAWRILKALEFDGILSLDRKGTLKGLRASDWRFAA